MNSEEKLDEILVILKRIEERQIKTTAMVEEVEKMEKTEPPVGSFATGYQKP